MGNDDSEIAAYLRGLLEHYSECELDNCPSCQILQGIFELVKGRLFTSPLFPEVMVSSGLVAANESD